MQLGFEPRQGRGAAKRRGVRAAVAGGEARVRRRRQAGLSKPRRLQLYNGANPQQGGSDQSPMQRGGRGAALSTVTTRRPRAASCDAISPLQPRDWQRRHRLTCPCLASGCPAVCRGPPPGPQTCEGGDKSNQGGMRGKGREGSPRLQPPLPTRTKRAAVERRLIPPPAARNAMRSHLNSAQATPRAITEYQALCVILWGRVLRDGCACCMCFGGSGSLCALKQAGCASGGQPALPKVEKQVSNSPVQQTALAVLLFRP